MNALPPGKYALRRVPRVYVNLRAAASAASADLGDLYPGTFVTLTGVASGDWVECVTADGLRGWCSLQGGAVVFEAVEVDATTPAPASPYALGIDISQAQTPLNWQQVKAGGVKFAIIRATQGTATSRPVGLDTRFHAHIDAALAAGMRVGVYTNYLPDADGGKQAEFYYAHIAPYLDRLSFPPAVDVETVNRQSKAVITGRLFDLTHTLQALGIETPMIYTSPGFWHEHTDPRSDDYFRRLPLWVAHWGVSKPTLPRAWKGKDWTLWQWQVKRDGIPGYPGKAIDLNRRKA